MVSLIFAISLFSNFYMIVATIFLPYSASVMVTLIQATYLQRKIYLYPPSYSLLHLAADDFIF